MPTRFRRTRLKGGYHGFLNLAVRLDGFGHLQYRLSQFPRAMQKSYLRQAMTAGARPVAVRMRSLLRSYSRSSKRKEGVGTSSRAVIIKTRNFRSNPSAVYSIVGVRRNWNERVYLDNAHKRSGVRGVYRKRVQSKKNRGRLQYIQRKNIGPIARNARLSPTKLSRERGFVLRHPAKYFHLINEGDRIRGRIVRKGHFIEQAHRAWDKNRVIERLGALIDRHWGKYQQGTKVG